MEEASAAREGSGSALAHPTPCSTLGLGARIRGLEEARFPAPDPAKVLAEDPKALPVRKAAATGASNRPREASPLPALFVRVPWGRFPGCGV